MRHTISLPLVLAGLLTMSSTVLASNATNSGVGIPGDNCSNPLPLALGSTPFDNTTFTESNLMDCGATIGADIFYTFTIPTSDDYTFDTCGSSFDTEIAVYLGSDCSAVCLTASDDTAPCGVQSVVEVVGAVAGDVYLLRVGGWAPTVTGSGVINANVTPPPPPVPANDSCATPDVAILGANAFDTTSASDSGFTGSGGACLATIFSDVFWTYTIPADGNYAVDTCGSSFDTEISVYLGAECSAVCIGSNDDSLSCPVQSFFAIPGALAGDIYLIHVGGWNPGTNGAGVMNVSITPPPPPVPSNDSCSAPDVAIFGANPFDNTAASDSGFTGSGGMCTATIFGDVFWTFTIPTDDNYAFNTCGSSFDTEMSVYVGADCSAVCFGSNDDGCAAQSQVDVPGALTGETYLIHVGGWNLATAGAGVMNVILIPPAPTNDTCATPDAITLGTTMLDTSSATSSGFNGGGPCADSIGQDVFFVFTVPSDDTYLFATCGSAIDTRIALHAGSDCTATCVDSIDDTCGLQSELTASFLAGDLVLVQVGGFGTAAGPITLDISITSPPPPPPANNDCSTPLAIPSVGVYLFNNELATTSGFDGGDPVLCMSPLNNPNSEFGESAKDLFWTFTVPCTGGYQFDTLASPGITDTRISVHLGDDCNATCVGSNDDENQAGGNFLSSLTLTGLAGGDTYLIQVGVWNETQVVGDGVLTVTRTPGDCPTFSIQCDPANDHFFGGYVDLSGSSQGGLLGAGLHLEASGGPPIATLGNYESWGFFLVSMGGAGNSTIDKGTLCLDVPWGRYNLQTTMSQGLPQLNSVGRFDAAGDLVNMAGTSTTGTGFDVPLELPFMPAGQTIAPGDTLYFQLWYRDIEAGVGNSSNLSNMLEMGF